MQLKRFVFTCAASLLLALASASYAADTPAEATANPTPEAAATPPAEVAANPSAEAEANPPMTTNAPPKSTSQTAMAATATASNPPVVTEPGRVFLIRDSAFFQLHIEKAVNYALKAEIAGNRGDSEVLQQHARTSLIQAREAQRAGNVAGLDEGIANLKRALSPSTWSAPAAMQASAEGTDPRCIDELERECGDVQPGSGRIQQCFDNKINNFTPMCQEKLKEGKAAIAAAVLGTRHQKEISGTHREEANLRSAIDAVREARKNLHQAQGTKLQPVEQFQNVAAY
jgi:hypothetical protein